MRKPLIWRCFVLMIIALTAFPAQGAEKDTIAVLPFDDGSIKERWWDQSWKLGEGVSDELITALLETNRFRIIEREQLTKVLDEQNIGAGGPVDPKSAARIGQILGVKYLVMGRVTEFGFKSSRVGAVSGTKGFGLGIKTTTARVSIDARLVDASTAEICAAVKGEGEKSQTNLGFVYDWERTSFGSDEFRQTNIGAALREAVNRVAAGLSEKGSQNEGTAEALTGQVAYVGGGKVYINLGASDGIQPGMVFTVCHLLDLVLDPATGEVIDEIFEPIAEITVAEVKERASTCTITVKLSSKFGIAVQDKVRLK